MNGWKYAWVDELPVEIYDVLIEEMTTHLQRNAAPDEVPD